MKKECDCFMRNLEILETLEGKNISASLRYYCSTCERTYTYELEDNEQERGKDETE